MLFIRILGGVILIFSVNWMLRIISTAKFKGYGCYSFSRNMGAAICGIILGLALLFDKANFDGWF